MKDEEIYKQLSRYKKILEDKGYNVIYVGLYGSQNYNLDDEESDIDAKAIIVPTSGGHSARVISNLRPHPLILALCSSEAVARRLSLNYGVYPIIVSVDHNDMDDVVNICREVAVKVLGLKEHDVVVIAGGIHANKSIKQTNFMKIEEI